MKELFFILVFISLAHASPLRQMDQRLKFYNETDVTCIDGSTQQSDEGLFIDVSCDFQCKDLVPKVERVKGTYIPKNLGLISGNGSNGTNIIWGGVGMSMKVWSQNICLEKATEACKSVLNIETYGMRELESGEWKMAKFPTCNEKTSTVSPFDNSANSIRVPSIVGLISKDVSIKTIDFNQAGLQFSLQPGKINFAPESCKKPIQAKLCFGDCVDAISVDIVETLGTKEPLGFEDTAFCGDELNAKLLNLKLSATVRREICESFYWQSYLKLEPITRSCSAIRGVTNCETF